MLQTEKLKYQRHNKYQNNQLKDLKVVVSKEREI